MNNVNNNAIRKTLLQKIDSAVWNFKGEDDRAVRKSQTSYDAATNSAEISAAVETCNVERKAARDKLQATINAAFEEVAR